VEWTRIKPDWPQLKNKFRTKSDKLTEADLEQIAGKRTKPVSHLETCILVTKTAIARFLISAAVFAIAAGCDGRGGLTPKDDSRVVSGDITTWGDPRKPGSGGGSGASVSTRRTAPSRCRPRLRQIGTRSLHDKMRRHDLKKEDYRNRRPGAEAAQAKPPR